MPEAAANAPATTTTTTQPTPSTAAPAPAAPPAEDHRAKMAQLERELENKKRENVIERRRHEKTFGEKLSRLGELEKREAMARSRPTEFLKSIYGDKWQEHLREVLVSGAAPAELIQSEVERMRDDFDKKLAQRDEAAQKDLREAQAAQLEQARRDLAAEAHDFYKENEKEYPVFNRLGSPERVAGLVAQRIEAAYLQSAKDGQPKVLRVKEAMDLIEAEILGYAEEAVSHDKYKPKFLEKLQPAKPGGNMPPVAQQQPSKPQQLQQQQPEQQQARRTLSNNLTGSTATKTPAMSDDERRERALAARQAYRGKAP